MPNSGAGRKSKTIETKELPQPNCVPIHGIPQSCFFSLSILVSAGFILVVMMLPVEDNDEDGGAATTPA
jgi:hypothetical protein